MLSFSSISAWGKVLIVIFGTCVYRGLIGFDELVSESLSNASVMDGPLPPMKPNIMIKSNGNAMLKNIDEGDFMRALKLAFAIALIARNWLYDCLFTN